MKTELNANWVRAFVVLAEALHYGHAARLLGISTPQLSRQINNLEKALGVTLFDRSTRTVHISDAGAELLPIARRASSAIIEMTHRARVRSTDAGPVLRIGVIGSGLGPFTAPVLDLASDHIAGLRIEMRTLPIMGRASSLRTHAVDVVFSPDVPTIAPPDLAYVTVADDPLGLLVWPGHPLAGRDSLQLAETDNEVYVEVEDDGMGTSDSWIFNPRADGTILKFGAKAATAQDVSQLVAAKMGVTISTRSTIQQIRAFGLVFVPLTDAKPSVIRIAALKNPMVPVVAEFMDLARAMDLGEIP